MLCTSTADQTHLFFFCVTKWTCGVRVCEMCQLCDSHGRCVRACSPADWTWHSRVDWSVCSCCCLVVVPPFCFEKREPFFLMKSRRESAMLWKQQASRYQEMGLIWLSATSAFALIKGSHLGKQCSLELPPPASAYMLSKRILTWLATIMCNEQCIDKLLLVIDFVRHTTNITLHVI